MEILKRWQGGRAQQLLAANDSKAKLANNARRKEKLGRACVRAARIKLGAAQSLLYMKGGTRQWSASPGALRVSYRCCTMLCASLLSSPPVASSVASQSSVAPMSRFVFCSTYVLSASSV